MMPGFITNTLESVRRQKAIDLIRQVVARHFEENPTSWNGITDKPAAFPPSAHTHTVAEVSGLQAALDGKLSSVSWSQVSNKPDTFSPSAHTHTWDQITGKPATYPPSAHTHAIADVTGLQAALDAPRGLVLMGTFTLTEAAFINLNLSVRKPIITVPGAVTTSSYIAIPVSATPVGYSVQEAVCTANGQITVSVLVPVIQLLSTYNIPVRVFRVNA